MTAPAKKSALQTVANILIVVGVCLMIVTAIVKSVSPNGNNPSLSQNSSQSSFSDNTQIGPSPFLGTNGLEYALIDGKNEYQLVGEGTATDLNITVASTYNGLPVTAIAEKAFVGSALTEDTLPHKITSVTIPEGITHIGENAFSNCTNLKKVTIQMDCYLFFHIYPPLFCLNCWTPTKSSLH